MTACATPHNLSFVQTTARIVAHDPASSRYTRLRLHCPQIAQRALPGQFVMLACAPDLLNGGSSSSSKVMCEPILPRPLAIMDAHSDEIELLYFVAGRGTATLRHTARRAIESEAIATDPLRIIGPLGHGFEPVPEAEIHIGVGGGSGVAPLVFFLRRYATQNSDAWHLILAARNREQLSSEAIIHVPGHLHQATDDGSAGFHGNGVQALIHLLDGVLKGKRVAIYAAGPEPMMAAASKVGRERGLPVRVSLEARMACGVGVCRACVVDGSSPHHKTGLKRRTVCQDGPVFDVNELAGW